MDFLYYYVYSDMSKLPIPRKILSYISGLSIEQLYDILVPFGYGGPKVRSVLTFAVLTGSTSSYFMGRTVLLDMERYQWVSQLPRSSIPKLAIYYGIKIPPLSFTAPYLYISLCKRQLVEDYLYLFGQYEEHNQDALSNILANKLGLIIINDMSDSAQGILRYVINDISEINFILQRPANLEDPPEIMGMKDEEATKILRQYTDRELYTFYDIPICFMDHAERIRRIILNSKRKTWRLESRICSNDNLLEINQQVPRKELNKDDSQNRFFSYGTPRNHACYSTEELNTSFRYTQGGVFRFFNPDNGPDFPIYSIRQLRDLLGEYIIRCIHKGDAAERLLAKIDEGVRYATRSIIN